MATTRVGDFAIYYCVSNSGSLPGTCFTTLFAMRCDAMALEQSSVSSVGLHYIAESMLMLHVLELLKFSQRRDSAKFFSKWIVQRLLKLFNPCSAFAL